MPRNTQTPEADAARAGAEAAHALAFNLDHALGANHEGLADLPK